MLDFGAVTLADLLTAAGAGIAAVIVTLTVDVIKAIFAKTAVAAWDGVMMAGVLSMVLYVLVGASVGVGTLEAAFSVFLAWLTCAAAAVGVHKAVVKPIGRALGGQEGGA